MVAKNLGRMLFEFWSRNGATKLLFYFQIVKLSKNAQKMLKFLAIAIDKTIALQTQNGLQCKNFSNGKLLFGNAFYGRKTLFLGATAFPQWQVALGNAFFGCNSVPQRQLLSEIPEKVSYSQCVGPRQCKNAFFEFVAFVATRKVLGILLETINQDDFHQETTNVHSRRRNGARGSHRAAKRQCI